MSTTLRWRAGTDVGEQAGSQCEHQRAVVVSEREQESPLCASRAADDGKRQQPGLQRLAADLARLGITLDLNWPDPPAPPPADQSPAAPADRPRPAWLRAVIKGGRSG